MRLKTAKIDLIIAKIHHLEDKDMKILFICTHNRCRSILAEAITKKIAHNTIEVKSAGSSATGTVHNLTLENLKRHSYHTKGLASTSWDDLGDFIPDVAITVCDNAAKEACPLWLGDAIKIHWGLTDPTKEGLAEEQRVKVFDQIIDTLEKRIEKLSEYDLNALSDSDIKTVFNDLEKIK